MMSPYPFFCFPNFAQGRRSFLTYPPYHNFHSHMRPFHSPVNMKNEQIKASNLPNTQKEEAFCLSPQAYEHSKIEHVQGLSSFTNKENGKKDTINNPSYHKYNVHSNNAYNNFHDNSSPCEDASSSFIPPEEQVFEIFGIKLASDDLLILALLFFLYKEEVKDTYLYISLILLLLS